MTTIKENIFYQILALQSAVYRKIRLSSQYIHAYIHSSPSPVNESQDYDYKHRDKRTNQIWNFRDDMCRTESQKTMKYVPFAINVCICEMLFLTCTEHTSTTLPVNESQDYDY